MRVQQEYVRKIMRWQRKEATAAIFSNGLYTDTATKSSKEIEEDTNDHDHIM